MMSRYFLIALLLCTPFWMQAQDFSVGFKAGLNFSSISGDSELNSQGEEVEDYKLTSGFVFGGRFNVKLADQFGLRAELIYGQKGAEYSFDGDSYWLFPTNAGGTLESSGTRRTALKVTNSYLELPIMAYARFGRIELSGGISVGALLSSRGAGELTFNGETADGIIVDPFTIILDFNYFGDPLFPGDPDEVDTRVLGGNTVTIPKTIGAYFENSDNDVKFFNTLDVGINAEIAFFLNQGLYIGLRGNYGLSDISRMDQDFSRLSLDENNEVMLRDDFDRNISLSASLGFSF